MKREKRILQVKDIDVIGQNIKRLRKEHHLNQQDFVAKLQLLNLDISTYSLSKIENGHQNPTVSLLIAVTKLLDCDYNALFQAVEVEDSDVL